MRKDTHEEFIKVGDFSAFITGVPDTCQHDDDGETLHFNDKGRYWKDSELPDDHEEKIKFMKDNRINGGCVSCSKCGKPFTPDFNAF